MLHIAVKEVLHAVIEGFVALQKCEESQDAFFSCAVLVLLRREPHHGMAGLRLGQVIKHVREWTIKHAIANFLF